MQNLRVHFHLTCTTPQRSMAAAHHNYRRSTNIFTVMCCTALQFDTVIAPNPAVITWSFSSCEFVLYAENLSVK
eukprot:scaffold8817_cov148-Skeletonema_menzelii.AAC.4